MLNGDCLQWLPLLETIGEKVDLIVTSPPYWDVANYHYDQWLRLWMLGGHEHPVKSNGPSEGKFAGKTHYRHLIRESFKLSSRLLRPDGTVYVRTDKRPFTYEVTMAALRAAFPQKQIEISERPFQKQTQTALYGDKSIKPGEIDIVLR